MTCEIVYPIEFYRDILNYTATDHDGVMADTRTMVTNKFNFWFGTSHTPDGLLTWNTVKKWGLEVGLNEKEAEGVEKKLWYSDDLLFSARPLPGAVEFMTKAYELGYKIPVFSSRYPRQREITNLWYGIYMPFVKPENIHVSLSDLPREIHKSWMINRGRSRPVKLFLEDSIDHTRLILKNTGASVVLLSGDTSLDKYLGSRLFRISSQKGKVPNLLPLYDAFFGSNRSVAQSY